MLTCKDFLKELSDYLDDSIDSQLRAELEVHATKCPNCWVIFDTSKKTLRIFKGMEPQAIPQNVHDRLMAAVQKKIAAKCGGSGT